jgi:ATP-binding cassette subfamily C protein CydCD
VLTFVVTAPAVTAGTLPVEVVAVLAFLPLALIDSLLASTEAVQQWPALVYQLKRIDGVLADDATAAPGGHDALHESHRIALNDVSARWPRSSRDAISNVSFSVSRGGWVVVTGPSGSGKSTLLTLLLGHLLPRTGEYSIGGTDVRTVTPSSLRKRIAWAPQDGYLFDSTLRANLLIARSREDAPSEQEMRTALARVGLSTMVDSLDRGLDAEVGAGGSHLSGGQRQRVVVARTLLTRADVVLLDEPTAHLDAEAADELMADLRVALDDKLVVLVTHHEDEPEADDVMVTLAAGGRALSQLAPALAD